jgi:hypothetical protein
LHLAFGGRNEDVVRLLLTAYPEGVLAKARYQELPWHMAALNGFYEKRVDTAFTLHSVIREG